MTIITGIDFNRSARAFLEVEVLSELLKSFFEFLKTFGHIVLALTICLVLLLFEYLPLARIARENIQKKF